MSRELELLAEIRDLLQVMAEPALAKRDAKLRSSLRGLVGSSKPKAKAALLMDGTRSKTVIAKQSGMDLGNLSRLVKSLAATKLIVGDDKHPSLLLKIPPAFFESDDANN
jgi:hypothetical protein